MPKGKPKVRFSDLYSEEDPSEAEARSQAPQAIPHARGGRWEVKDEDKTGTHWDDRHHVELKRAAEEAGVYKKDMSKVEMIHVLANKDRIDEFERRAGEREARRRRKEIQAREKKVQEERVRRKQDRERRRTAGEDYVSETTDSEPEGFHDQTDYESTSTMTPSTSHSIEPIHPAQRLRIYEWPHFDMPSPHPPPSPLSPTGRLRKIMPELLPKKLPYAVMKLITTFTGEKVELPGRQYADEVGPDFVLSLSEHTKDCARNGIMYGQLQRAIIERGADWAERTQVQWWNGRMYLELPPRSASKKSLADVYAKWRKKNEYRRFEQKKKRAIGKSEPKRKAAQRLRDQRQKMIDACAVSEYRPPICYMPSYLDYPLLEDDEEAEKSVDNLFYIRFPEMDLPHYYFWTAPGEWEDPTQPNPEWLETEVDEAHEQRSAQSADRRKSQGQSGRRNTRGSISAPSQTKKMLVKRTPVPRKFWPSVTPPKTSKYKTALWAFEKDFYNKGWPTVSKEARERWIAEGKTAEWSRLIRNLPKLYPAGNLPTAPPINPPPEIASLAEKFAAIEVPNDTRPIQPIIGDEPWTRDDQAYWKVVEVPEVMDEHNPEELLRAMGSPNTLERRSSEVASWMHSIPNSPYSPSVPQPRRPSTPTTNSANNQRQLERLEWEDLFLHRYENGAALNTTIDPLPIAQLKDDLHSIRHLRKAPQQCHTRDTDDVVLCTKCHGTLNLQEAQSHLAIHRREANDLCPFCGIEWNLWTSELKASHIFFHNSRSRSEDFSPLNDDEIRRIDELRRRSSAASSGINALYAVPRTKRRRSSERLRELKRSIAGAKREQKGQREHDDEEVDAAGPGSSKRRISKVSFSPFTVEKRVAYNDFGVRDWDEEGADADVSSLALSSLASPRRRSLRSADKRPIKSALKIDTKTGAASSSRLRSGSHIIVPRGNNDDDEEEDVEDLGNVEHFPDKMFHILAAPSTRSTNTDIQIEKPTGRRPSALNPLVDWDPCRYSTGGSERVPSSVLHNAKRYPDGHPNAAWDPRKASKSSLESLEFRERSRASRKSKRRGKAKGKQKVVDDDDDDGEGAVASLERKSSNATVRSLRATRGKKRSVDDITNELEDTAYQDMPESTSSYEYVTCKVPKKRAKIQDRNYRDIPPSTPSTESRSPVPRKRKNPTDPTYRNQPSPTSSSAAVERPVKKRRIATTKQKAKGKGKGPASRVQLGGTPQDSLQLAPSGPEDSHHASTMSNASSGSDTRRLSALSSEGLNPIGTSPSTRWQRVHPACEPWCSLQRRSSGAAPSPLLDDDDDDEGYIPFIDSPLLEDHTSDVLTGNPFAPPPKKAAKGKAKRKEKGKKPVQSTKQGAITFKYNTEATDLANRREARTQEAKKTTILGRPYVEPLIMAPARRWAPSSSKSIGESSTASSTDGLLDFLDSASASSSSSSLTARKAHVIKDGGVFGIAAHAEQIPQSRGRRSSAPTPSPSLEGQNHRGPVSTTNPTTPKKSPGKRTAKPKTKSSQAAPPIDIEATRKRHSYDVPFSDARSVVPPNTPAASFARYKRTRSSTDEDGSTAETALDVDQLSHKIGNVKTTRGGLVRDLPAKTVGAKGRPRGVSISKDRGRVKAKRGDMEDGVKREEPRAKRTRKVYVAVKEAAPVRKVAKGRVTKMKDAVVTGRSEKTPLRRRTSGRLAKMAATSISPPEADECGEKVPKKAGPTRRASKRVSTTPVKKTGAKANSTTTKRRPRKK